MPKAFTDCVAAGGKVRTIKPNAHTYLKVCIKGGKSTAGEVKQTKGK